MDVLDDGERVRRRRESALRWRKNNPERVAEINRESNEKRRIKYHSGGAEAAKARASAYYYANKESAAASAKRYRDRNRDRIKARSREYAITHPEVNRRAVAKYRSSHLDELKAAAKRWWARNTDKLSIYHDRQRGNRLSAERRRRARNPDAFRAKVRARKALRRGAPVCDLTQSQWFEILAEYAYSCAYCGSARKKLEQDHVLPLSMNGSHTRANVVPACRTCNAKKGARIWEPKKPNGTSSNNPHIAAGEGADSESARTTATPGD